MKETLLSAVIIAGFALSSSMAHADVVMKSGRVSLTGGTIAPSSSLDVGLAGLNAKFRYDIECTISDANNAANPVVIGIDSVYYTAGSSMLGEIFFNGSRVGGGSLQAALPGTKTLLEIHSISPYAQGITISNSDLDDSLDVSNCSAVPASY